MIHKDHFTFYVNGQNRVSTMPFPINVVNDLEVLNPEELIVRIKLFTDSEKIQPSYLLFVMAPTTLFDLHMKDADAETQKQEETLFLDTVPFEVTASRTYTVMGKKYLVATNKTLCTSIKEGFEKVGSKLSSVVPTTMITGLAFGELNADIGKQLAKRWDELKHISLLEITPEQTPMISGFVPDKGSHSRLPLLLGIFVSLVGILGILMVTQNRAPSPTTSASTPVAPPTVIVAATATPAPVASDSAELQQKIQSVKIIADASQVDLQNRLTQVLTDLGITNIQTETSVVKNPRPLLVFSSSINASIKEEFIVKTRDLLGEISIQEADTNPYQLIITLGASQ